MANQEPSPDLLRGIALGIEAAKQRCERYAQNFCDKRGNPPPREQSAPNYWEHRSAQMCASLIGNISPADIAAKNPIDDAAGRV